MLPHEDVQHIHARSIHAKVGQAKVDEVRGEHGRQPTEHLVDAEKQLVIVKFGKRLSFRDIERYTNLLRADPAFRPSFSEIADLSEVEELGVEADEFLKLADKTDPFSPDAKRAFVARSPVQTHAARMHKILRTQRNIEIFSTLEAAEVWIRG